MRLPRVSIGTIMVLLVLIALDIALINAMIELDGPDPEAFAGFGLLGMGNILAFGYIRLIRRRGRAGPFLQAFLACGTVTLLAYLICAWAFHILLLEFAIDLGRLIEGTYKRRLAASVRAYGHEAEFKMILEIGFFGCLCLIIAAPQVLLASICGWIFSRYRLGHSRAGALPRSE